MNLANPRKRGWWHGGVDKTPTAQPNHSRRYRAWVGCQPNYTVAARRMRIDGTTVDGTATAPTRAEEPTTAAGPHQRRLARLAGSAAVIYSMVRGVFQARRGAGHLPRTGG